MHLIELTLIFFGLFIAFVVDILWWVSPVFKKTEKGMEAHEHYHIGIELIILFILVDHFFNTSLGLILLGAGIGFLMAEWSQSKEIKGKIVVPGHPFAYKSSHFKSSSLIGILLTGAAIALYIYLGTL